MFAFMNSQKRILFIALLSVLLTACSSAALTPTAVSTSATAVASPYDGLWQGQGSAQDGRQITVKFTVQNGAISSFSYTYLRPDNVPCTGIDHSVIPAESQPRIASAAFSQVFGPDLTASGSFTSPQSASGNIAIVWQGRAYLNSCNASLQAASTAGKGQSAQNVVVAPVASAWCGKNVNCNDLLTQLLIFGLVNGAILALNAIGVTVIYSTVRMLNLAHGDVFALTTAFVTSTINIIGLDLSWPLQNRILILAAVLAGAVVFGALLSMGVEALAF